MIMLREVPRQNDLSTLVKLFVLQVFLFLSKQISKAAIINSINGINIYNIDFDLAMAVSTKVFLLTSVIALAIS